MKRVKRIVLITMVAVSALSFAAFAEEEKADKVLATVGSEKITEADLFAKISTLPPQFRARYETPDGKKKLLDQTIKFSLLSQEARAQGIDKKDEVAKKIKEISDNIIIQELTKQEVSDRVSASDEDIKTYYDENNQEFIKPEKIKANLILFEVKEGDSTDVKKEKEAKARETLKKIKDGADFEELAKQVSDDKRTKKRGGSTGFFSEGRRKNTYGEKFEEVAFSLKQGELSDVFESKKGFYIVKVTEKKAEEQQSLEQAKSRIERKLKQAKQKEVYDSYVEELKKKYPVKMVEQ